ncbi:hypothetical protein P3T18_001181 [Paraburkholderia sp. GAS199]|uniref:hypothetical protein n=1 Tax=Paraburkholderia sp. GAS199 TaxID=3035126 RepID=UPI003D22C8EF
MPDPTTSNNHPDPEDSNTPEEHYAPTKRVSDEDAQHALDGGDKEKIDRALDELDVSTTKSGADQSAMPDTEGSNSSSKNLDKQDD